MAQTYIWSGSGEALHVSLSAGTLTLSFAGRTNLSFDGEGRLVGAWYDGLTYRRGLDNRLLLKWTDKQSSVRRRNFLSAPEAESIIDRAYADAAKVLDGVNDGRLEQPDLATPTLDEIVRWLKVVVSLDFDTLEASAAEFRRVYKPISILPPDQYLSFVLQATEGCSYNECSFCTFYRDRPFRIKGLDEFESHIDAATAFMGRGVHLRRSIFLADANAIIIAQNKLVPLLEAINRRYRFRADQSRNEPAIDLPPNSWSPDGVNAFVSAPDALHKSADNLRELAALNVKRLYIGLETGHDPLRKFLRKPGSAADALAAVRAIKASGLSVGIILMSGVGGEAFRNQHFSDTVDTVARMPLDRNDLVYVSPFVATPDSPYLDDMQWAGYSSLSESEIHAEEQRFKEALSPILKPHGVRISRYDIREFVY